MPTSVARRAFVRDRGASPIIGRRGEHRPGPSRARLFSSLHAHLACRLGRQGLAGRHAGRPRGSCPPGRHRRAYPLASLARVVTAGARSHRRHPVILDSAAGTASPHAVTAGKVAGVLRGLETYVSGQSGLIIDYATAPTARRNDEPISTVTTESTVQRLLHRRMSDNQQMRWSPRGAHLKLKVRTAVVNGTLNTCSRSTSSVGALVFIGESCSNSMLAEQGSCSDYYASIPSRAPEAHAQQHHAERVCADLAAPPTIDVPLPVRGLHVDHAF